MVIGRSLMAKPKLLLHDDRVKKLYLGMEA
jgi:ABC-type branched-subunit amino acid transport system ATPase component